MYSSFTNSVCLCACVCVHVLWSSLGATNEPCAFDRGTTVWIHYIRTQYLPNWTILDAYALVACFAAGYLRNVIDDWDFMYFQVFSPGISWILRWISVQVDGYKHVQLHRNNSTDFYHCGRKSWVALVYRPVCFRYVVKPETLCSTFERLFDGKRRLRPVWLWRCSNMKALSHVYWTFDTTF